MKMENFDYLKDQLKFNGFGEELFEALKKGMDSGSENFRLKHEKQYGNDKVEATLNFRLSDQGNYFFNSYDMALSQGHRDKPLTMTFYVFNDKLKVKDGEPIPRPTISFKEAFNLLSGRSIYKDVAKLEKKEIFGKTRYVPTGETDKKWLVIPDFSDKNGNQFKVKQYGKEYGFDLRISSEKYNIKEMQQEDTAVKFLGSLEKGNHTAATFMTTDGKEKNGYVEAAVRFKDLNLFDDSHKRIRQIETPTEKVDKKEQKSISEKNDVDGKPKRARKPAGTKKVA